MENNELIPKNLSKFPWELIINEIEKEKSKDKRKKESKDKLKVIRFQIILSSFFILGL